MESLRVRVLGPFEVDGMPAAEVGTRKARTLLKVLALGRGRPVSVDHIVEVLWDAAPPARANEQVAVLVSRLRSTLGRERIAFGDGGYSLHLDWLDLDALDALAHEAQRRLDAAGHSAARAAAGAALALVRGPLLADEPDAPWLDLERAAAARLVARTRHVAAHAALATGDPVDAAEFAQGALDHDPYDEEALRLLMRAWVAAGRPASALAAYARTRARLGEDLGVDPSTETEAVHTAIVRDEPLGDARPTPVTNLVGRDQELAALDAAANLARAGTPHVVLVTGDAGIGKSTLLGAWAERATATGAVVLRGAADELARSLPLQPLADAIDRYLRGAGSERAAEIVGTDASLLDPLLGRGAGASPMLADGLVGPAALYGALAAVLERIGDGRLVALLLDDIHLAGPAIGAWLAFVHHRALPLVVVTAARAGETVSVPVDTTVAVAPLDLDAVTRLVGDELAPHLWERSAGNPLFLNELAAADPADDLPATIRAAVAQRCDRLGDAAASLRAAAVLGRTIDLDLLAAVTRTDPVELLEHLEAGTGHGLLEETDDGLSFRHDLVREALAAATPATRAALVHREAARALVARGHAEPLDVAYHARLGGDTEVAAQALADAAAIASARHDHVSAEQLLDQSLALRDEIAARLARARVRILRTNYGAAVEDVEEALASGAGAEAFEVAGWASYYARDVEAAKRYADDGARLATDDAARGRCLSLAGRVRHGSGDLAAADELLEAGARTTEGRDRVVASVWLGSLRSHQSRVEEALAMLRPATRLAEGRETIVLLHAMVFGGHALAIGGRPAEALTWFDRYEREAEARQVARFFGRGDNFAAWVLRNIGAGEEAGDRNERALERGGHAFRETYIAAHLDLADDALRRGDIDRAGRHIACTDGDIDAPELIFGWRQRLKRRWLEARTAFSLERYDDAVGLADTLAADAARLGIPRYAVPARVLVARARAAKGDPVEPARVGDDVDRLDAVVAIEAWWLTAEAARDLRVPAWFDLAEARAASLAEHAGDRAAALLLAAEREVSAARRATARRS